MGDYIETGIEMYSKISSELLINIFIPNTPLHDGAVILQKDQVAAAACYLPLSESPFISKELGTRHRAALGISEVTDSLTVIVSEETGGISLTKNGELYRDLTKEEFRELLTNGLLGPKSKNKLPQLVGTGGGRDMDKMFDKLTDSRWFMKLVALVLALLLFGSVYDGSNTNDINVPGDEETDTISDIPVKSYFDTENLVVTGVPSTVEVTLTGPTPNLQAAKAQKDFEVYVDLSKVKVGKQRIKLQIKDLSDKLKATMDPEYIEVDVQEKVTKEFSVDVEFDDTMVEDGYVAGSPVVKPNKVAITGGKEVMDQISYVRAIVELDDFVTDSVEKSAIITVLDANLNKLNVTVEQETVRVSIPIKRDE